MFTPDFEVEPVGSTLVPSQRFGKVTEVPEAVALNWLTAALPEGEVKQPCDWSRGRAYIIQSAPLEVTGLQRSFDGNKYWLIQKGRPNSLVAFEGHHYSVFRPRQQQS